MVRIDIDAYCILPQRNGPERAKWIAADFGGRESLDFAYRSMGMLSEFEPDFSSAFMPDYFWPPWHACAGGSGQEAVAGQAVRIPDATAEKGYVAPGIKEGWLPLPGLGLLGKLNLNVPWWVWAAMAGMLAIAVASRRSRA